MAKKKKKKDNDDDSSSDSSSSAPTYAAPDSQPNRADADLSQLVGNYGAPASSASAINPMYLPQPGLEAQVPAAAQTPLNPMVKAIMQRFALLNLIRNRRNQALVDPSDQTGGY